jgi:glycosyltransferase involved in cell wall biosynthesis
MNGELISAESIIWINARFLTRPVTGVERVAREVISAIVRHHLDADGCWRGAGKAVRFVLLAPRTPQNLSSPWPELRMIQAGAFQGHAWEQWDVPRLTAGRFVLNFCNTAPLFKRRQWTFLHDAQTFAIPQNFKPGLRYWYRLMFWCTARWSAGVWTNSTFSASELQRYLGVDPAHFTVAHLGADHVDRVHEHNSPRLQLLFEQLAGHPFVLAVSSDNPNKNFAAVIQALQSMGRDAPACVIVGQKNERVFSQTTLSTERVHWLGYVTDAELVALYRRAAAMAYPSFYEGFGLPPLEAMWHGCPVVVARSSALPEISGDAALYCDPNDPNTLAQALKSLVQDAELRQRMGVLGQARARTFVWEKTADIILGAIKTKIRL